jgi:hypothetical protein
LKALRNLTFRKALQSSSSPSPIARAENRPAPLDPLEVRRSVQAPWRRCAAAPIYGPVSLQRPFTIEIEAVSSDGVRRYRWAIPDQTGVRSRSAMSFATMREARADAKRAALRLEALGRSQRKLGD